MIVQLIETQVGVLEQEAQDGCVADFALQVCFPHGGQRVSGYEFDVFQPLHVAVLDVPDDICHFDPLSPQQFLSQLLVATGHFGKDDLLGVAGVTWLGLFEDFTEKDLRLLFLKRLFGRLFVGTPCLFTMISGPFLFVSRFLVGLSMLFMPDWRNTRSDDGGPNSLEWNHFLFQLLRNRQVKLLILLHIYLALRRTNDHLIIFVSNQSMAVDLKPIYTLFWVKLEAPPQEILALFTYLHPIKSVLSFPGLFQQSSWAAGKYRKPPKEHLEKHYSNRPDIRPKIIGKALHDFGCHSEIAAQFGPCHLFPHELLAETQVDDLADALMQHHILHLEITMHGPHLMQPLEPIQDLLQIIDGKGFFHPLITKKYLSQLKPAAVLKHDELVFSMLEILEESDHIGATALLEDGDFRLDQFLQLRHLLQLLQGSHLYCRLLEGACVFRQIDISPVALPDQFEQAQVVNGES